MDFILPWSVERSFRGVAAEASSLRPACSTVQETDIYDLAALETQIEHFAMVHEAETEVKSETRIVDQSTEKRNSTTLHTSIVQITLTGARRQAGYQALSSNRARSKIERI